MIWQRLRRYAAGIALLASACATAAEHGTITPMSVASRHDWTACKHDVPEEACVQCHPEHAAKFKARGDWCQEHEVPESQCLKCHPDIDFSPPKKPPERADIVEIAHEGETLPELESHRVPGKVTIFDFYAAWCPPCRKVDEHLYPILAQRSDIAIRKVNVSSWDTPIAERWLGDVAELPYLVIYAKNGRRIRAIAGAQLEEIDRAIAEGDR